jgi:hypothetical protein
VPGADEGSQGEGGLMGLRKESIEQCLREMDGIVQELDKYRDVNLDSLRG